LGTNNCATCDLLLWDFRDLTKWRLSVTVLSKFESLVHPSLKNINIAIKQTNM